MTRRKTPAQNKSITQDSTTLGQGAPEALTNETLTNETLTNETLANEAPANTENQTNIEDQAGAGTEAETETETSYLCTRHIETGAKRLEPGDPFEGSKDDIRALLELGAIKEVLAE